jgi:putative colanic acid biosynthesis acetyltransferase WcaF
VELKRVEHALRVHRLPLSNKVARLAWRTVWVLLYRPSPRIFHGWRRFLLRLFGARMGRGTFAYPSVQIWAPWNLEMHDHSCLSHFVDCYCVDKVVIGRHATVSQYSFLCTASHDFNRPEMPIVAAPITIGAHAWVTADVFVGPGVTVGEGAVVGARSTVLRDVAAWTVVAGAPARPIGTRDAGAFARASPQGAPDERGA